MEERKGGRRRRKSFSVVYLCCLMAIVCFLKMIGYVQLRALREDDWATNGPNELRWWRNALRTCIKKKTALFFRFFLFSLSFLHRQLPMAIVQCNNKMMKTPWKKKMLSFKLRPCGAEQTFGVPVTERTTSNGDLAWEGSLSITRLSNFRRNFKKNQLLLFQNSPLLPFKAPRKKETHDRTNENVFFF